MENGENGENMTKFDRKKHNCFYGRREAVFLIKSRGQGSDLMKKLGP